MEKTPEELRKEMFEQMKNQNSGQHLTEVAIPGVIQDIKTDK